MRLLGIPLSFWGCGLFFALAVIGPWLAPDAPWALDLEMVQG